MAVTCAKCGSVHEVKSYSFDPDIRPLPLCLLCWARICGFLDDDT